MSAILKSGAVLQELGSGVCDKQINCKEKPNQNQTAYSFKVVRIVKKSKYYCILKVLAQREETTNDSV